MHKLSRSVLSFGVLIALGTTACDKSDNADVDTAKVKTGLRSSVQSMMSFRSGKGGLEAVGSMMEFGSISYGILEPQEEKSKDARRMADQARKLARMAREEGGDNCSCDETKCNFDGCDLDGYGKLEGKLEWSETSLNCDYKATFSLKETGVEMSTTLSTFCDLKFTETTLDGKLSHKGELEGKGVDGEVAISWDTSFVFEGIKYDADKNKITKGIAKVDAEVAVEGEETLRGSASIDFSKE